MIVGLSVCYFFKASRGFEAKHGERLCVAVDVVVVVVIVVVVVVVDRIKTIPGKMTSVLKEGKGAGS